MQVLDLLGRFMARYSLAVILFSSTLTVRQGQSLTPKDEVQRSSELLRVLIQDEFRRVREEGRLKINGGGNDISSVVERVIKPGDGVRSASEVLVEGGFSLQTLAKADSAGGQMKYIFATSSAVLGLAVRRWDQR